MEVEWRDQRAAPAAAVVDLTPRDVVPPQPRDERGPIDHVEADADDIQPIAVRGAGLLDPRDVVQARRTPRRPELDEHDASAEVFQCDAVARHVNGRERVGRRLERGAVGGLGGGHDGDERERERRDGAPRGSLEGLRYRGGVGSPEGLPYRDGARGNGSAGLQPCHPSSHLHPKAQRHVHRPRETWTVHVVGITLRA